MPEAISSRSSMAVVESNNMLRNQYLNSKHNIKLSYKWRENDSPKLELNKNLKKTFQPNYGSLSEIDETSQ